MGEHKDNSQDIGKLNGLSPEEESGKSKEYDKLLYELECIIDGKDAEMVANVLFGLILTSATPVMRQIQKKYRWQFIEKTIMGMRQGFIDLEEDINAQEDEV